MNADTKTVKNNILPINMNNNTAYSQYNNKNKTMQRETCTIRLKKFH